MEGEVSIAEHFDFVSLFLVCRTEMVMHCSPKPTPHKTRDGNVSLSHLKLTPYILV